MVLSAVGRRRKKKISVSLLPLPAAPWRQTPRRPFLSAVAGKHGQPETQRQTNGLDVHIRKQNTQTWRAYRRASSRLFKNPWATPDAVICLFISPLHPISLSLHTLCSCLALFLSPLHLLSLRLPAASYRTPWRPPLHPSLCSPPVSTLIF